MGVGLQRRVGQPCIVQRRRDSLPTSMPKESTGVYFKMTRSEDCLRPRLRHKREHYANHYACRTQKKQDGLKAKDPSDVANCGHDGCDERSG